MADDTYQPLVYMMQGGDEMVVASSGLVTVEDGGSIDLESGGGIDVQSGADITVESGGSIVWPASGATSSAVGSTTLTEFAANGVSLIASSGDERKFFIDYPYPGAEKWLFNTAGATAMTYYFAVSTAATPDVGIITTDADSTAHMMVVEGTTSGALAGWCHLVGLSTSRWLRVAHSPTSQWVVVSTSS